LGSLLSARIRTVQNELCCSSTTSPHSAAKIRTPVMIWIKLFCSLLIQVHTLCYQLSCYYLFHFAFILTEFLQSLCQKLPVDVVLSFYFSVVWSSDLFQSNSETRCCTALSQRTTVFTRGNITNWYKISFKIHVIFDT